MRNNSYQLNCLMNIIFDLIQVYIYTLIMFGHFKKSASIWTNQDTQTVGNDR